MAPRVILPHGRLCVTGTFGADGMAPLTMAGDDPSRVLGTKPLVCLSRVLVPAR